MWTCTCPLIGDWANDIWCGTKLISMIYVTYLYSSSRTICYDLLQSVGLSVDSCTNWCPMFAMCFYFWDSVGMLLGDWFCMFGQLSSWQSYQYHNLFNITNIISNHLSEEQLYAVRVIPCTLKPWRLANPAWLCHSVSLQISRRSLNITVCYSNILARLLDKMKNAVASLISISLCESTL